jgi:1,4-alpha-glucan branching enzyme
LLFMGNEFAQTTEWNYKTELSWELLQYDSHKKMQDCVKSLNHLYSAQPALHELQFDMHGFEWIDLNHRQEGIIVFKRKGKQKEEDVLVVLNMTPVVRRDWKIKVSGKDKWKEIFNSDQTEFWGTGDVYNPAVKTKLLDKETDLYEINVHLPALSGIVFR